MHYKKLGRTDLFVSAISFGGLPLFFLTPKKATDLINAALDEGINYFDLDEAYNQFIPTKTYQDSKAKMGEVLKTRRNECYVGVKCMRAKSDEVAFDIDNALNLVFKGTKPEVIDLFHLCHVDVDEKLDLLLSHQGGLITAEKARDEGKIKHILIASHNPKILIRALKTNRFDVAEFPFTIIEDEYLKEVIPYCKANNIGTIVMKPLGGGQLAEYATLSLRWIMQHDVNCIIPGMKTKEELKQNAAIGHQFTPLSANELTNLKRVAEPLGKEYCHRCGYCLPCPEGISIISQMDIYRTTMFTREQKIQLFKDLKQKGGKNAADCVACKECTEKCPFKLPIPDIMEKIKVMFEL
jgi:hypothetical protein